MGYDRTLLNLYMAHRCELVNYASGIVGDRSHAEDVVQEAWLRLGAASASKSLQEPVGYMYRIVRNLAIDGRRRDAREALVVEADADASTEERPDDYPSPEIEAVAKAELRLLEQAMAELPERTRLALEMRRFGGLKLREIAERLGISTTVAHTIVAEGLAHCLRRVRSAE